MDGGSWFRRVRNASQRVPSPILTFDSSVVGTLFGVQMPHRSQVPHLRQRPLTSSFPQQVHVWFESMEAMLLSFG